MTEGSTAPNGQHNDNFFTLVWVYFFFLTTVNSLLLLLFLICGFQITVERVAKESVSSSASSASSEAAAASQEVHKEHNNLLYMAVDSCNNCKYISLRDAKGCFFNFYYSCQLQKEI